MKPKRRTFLPDDLTLEVFSALSQRELRIRLAIHREWRRIHKIDDVLRKRPSAWRSSAVRQALSHIPILPIPKPRDMFNGLPDEICLKILGYLMLKELCLASTVSREWNRLACDGVLWKIRCFREFGRSFVLGDLVGRMTAQWKSNFRLLREVSSPLVDLAGTYHGVAIADGGRLLVWGSQDDHETEAPLAPRHYAQLMQESVVACSVRFTHFLALGVHGETWSWGNGANGRLGHGHEGDVEVPRRIAAFRGKKIVYVAAGTFHSAAISATGELFTWGCGNEGELGHGDVEDCFVPRVVERLQGTRMKRVSVHGYHSIALSTRGQVFTWGLNTWGQLGLGHRMPVTSPTLVSDISKTIACVSAGWRHSVLVSEKGRVYTCGSSLAGQTGHGDFHHSRKVFEKVKALKGVKIVLASAAGHTVVLGANGGVWCWGLGREGQLGIGETRNCSKPKRVIALLCHKVVTVGAGGGHTIAITDDGAMFAWGEGVHGQLCHSGRAASVDVPTRIDVLDHESLLAYATV